MRGMVAAMQIAISGSRLESVSRMEAVYQLVQALASKGARVVTHWKDKVEE